MNGTLRLRGAAIVLALVLAGCASAPVPTSMAATPANAATARAPGGVAVSVSGGRDSTGLDAPNVGDADFKAAVEQSLARAALFERVGDDAAARYALAAHIVRLEKPLGGFTMTVTFEVGWSLVDRQGERVLLRKLIVSTGSASVSDAFVGATRIRLAVEAAARANVEQLLQALSALGY